MQFSCCLNQRSEKTNGLLQAELFKPLTWLSVRFGVIMPLASFMVIRSLHYAVNHG
jgi:hypothetical protein